MDRDRNPTHGEQSQKLRVITVVQGRNSDSMEQGGDSNAKEKLMLSVAQTLTHGWLTKHVREKAHSWVIGSENP